MDGLTLTRELRNALNEPSGGTWLDTRFTYDCLYRAACATISRGRLLTSSQAITTVANDSNYNLNGDFVCLYLMDDENRRFVKYYDTSSTSFIYEESYDSIYLANNSTGQSIPNGFCLRDANQIARITGTTTSTGSVSNGETILTNTGADFTNVYPGDLVHNTTDASSGIVVVKNSTTSLVCSLFDGTNNYFTNGDAYIIIPQMRYELVIDPPSLSSGHTITVPYITKPVPVYSNYRAYNIPSGYQGALVNYAAWIYKYRDREPSFGDGYYRYWEHEMLRLAGDVRRAKNTGGFKVNMIKRSRGSSSYR